MEVHFAPELQAKIDQLVNETGCSVSQLVEDAMVIYLSEVADTRMLLDRRYDDLKSGRVKSVSREEIVEHFHEKSAAARRAPRGS